MTRSSGNAAQAILFAFKNLSKLDKVTGLASVELWVLVTTVLLVLRFLFDFSGPWFGNPRRMSVVLTLEILNTNLVIYTMGLMQLSGKRVNDYFQVWAVLLVTLQYSVKIGRPYTRSKQVPLLDLMSSFWSANLLRVQTFYLLKIPLWLIWSLNAVRIIVLFVSSGKGEKNNQESMRLVSDYMSYEDTLSVLDDQEKEKFSMSGYKYLVHGEHRVLKEVQEDPFRSDRGYRIQLDPDGVHREQLVTIEKLWNDTRESGLLGGRADPGNQRKDLCLSFALYKLLRRRFHDLPMHELTRVQGKKKIRRLTFDYILENSERALRITGAELYFLRDLFYSKHATMFAGGLQVPLRSLLLSLSLATAVGYIAYPARYIPERMDPADRNRITHGVSITRLMVAIIALKELSEIILYVFSRWAKVLILCKYVQHRFLWRPAVESAMRFMLYFGSKPKLNNQTVRQQNLLVTGRVMKPGVLFPFTIRMEDVRGVIFGTTRLTDYMQSAILESLKNLKNEDKYFSNAFKKNENVQWPSNLRAVDTHIILVWHIATSLCEIHFYDKVQELKAVQRPRPFVMEPNGTRHKRKSKRQAAPGHEESESLRWYATAISLSNYCAYLVRKELVPDNGLVARKVLDEVIREIDYVTCKVSVRYRTLKDVYKCLMKTVGMPCKNSDHRKTGSPDVEAVPLPQVQGYYEVDKEYKDLHIGCSLTRMGAELGDNLTMVYHGDTAGLWRDLANFWKGFLLHLAANTRPGTHGKYLAGEIELITHLWALLTHAGYGGKATDGEQGLDQEGSPDIIQI